jgi:type VI secretion system protein ImpG
MTLSTTVPDAPMKDLLPHYEQELSLLRQRAAEFAARYPGLASHLQIGHGASGDPHTERLIQATALLTARVNKSLEDGYSRFTESFLETLFPHYLRPFPSCAIVQARLPAEAASGPLTPRGTELRAATVDGVECRFRTCYDIRHLPVRLTQARFNPVLNVPPSIRVPVDSGTSLVIDIEAIDQKRGFGSFADSTLRVYLDGEASVVAVARDILQGRIAMTCIETGPGDWQRLPSTPLAIVGFADNEALVPFSPRSHPAYRLLAEYFTFPEKFNFLDINFANMVPRVPAECRRVTLHLFLADVRADSHEAGLLSTLSANNFVLGCAPVVNLFRQNAVPILVTHERADYPLLSDPEHAWAYDIHSVDTVRMLRQGEQDTSLIDFRPFYSLRHGEGKAKSGHYYAVRRDEAFEAGHEYRIAFVDADFDPVSCEQATVSVELTCTNRDLPCRIAYGQPAGDLSPSVDSTNGTTIKFVRRPTVPRRFAATPALQWRLLSHLTLNFHSLVQEGLDGFREMLSLYDLVQTSATQRQIEAIVGLGHRPTTAWIRNERGPSLAHGIEVCITVDEDAFVGSGLMLFAHVIDRFLSLYVQINSFTELVVLSNQTGKELIRCQPRSGDLYLA